MLETPSTPPSGRTSRKSGRTSVSSDSITSATPTHIMSTRGARARANAISEPSSSDPLGAASSIVGGSTPNHDGDDDADDEDDDQTNARAPSGGRPRGSRAGRPRKTSTQRTHPPRSSSPTIEELLQDQDYHMVDYEDFEDSASVIERFALDDFRQEPVLDHSVELDAEIQQILSGATAGIHPSIEEPFSDTMMDFSDAPVYASLDHHPIHEARRRRSHVNGDNSDVFANFHDLIGPYPTLHNDVARNEEAQTRLRLTMRGFHASSFPGTPLPRRRYGSPSNHDAGYETDRNPLPGSNTLRPSALHQSRTDLAPLSPYSASSYMSRRRRRGPPTGTFKTDKSQAHAMLNNDGESLLIVPATMIGHDCRVSTVIEDMANGTFDATNIKDHSTPVDALPPGVDGDGKEALRSLAQQGAHLLEESFSNFASLGVLSPPAEPLMDTEQMDEFEAMACIENFIDFGSDEDDGDVPESMDTSALVTHIASPVGDHEATFAPSADYITETSTTRGLVDGFDTGLIGAFRTDPDLVPHNPYSSAFEDDALTSPLFPSQSSVVSPSKRRREHDLADDESDARPEKRVYLGSGIEVSESKY